MGKTSKRQRIRWLACFGLVAVLVFPVPGDEPGTSDLATASPEGAYQILGDPALTWALACGSRESPPAPLFQRGETEAGLRAYVDPATGRLAVPPPEKRGDLELAAELRQALETSHEGLTEVVRPDGSAFIHLQGRFQSALFATVDEDGRLRTGHLPASLPAPRPVGAEETSAAPPREGDE